MLKFYSNVKWACQLVLQNPKQPCHSPDYSSHDSTMSIERQEEIQYSKELWMHRFYIHVEKVLCSVMRLECLIQEKELDRKQKVLAEETYDVQRSLREDYDEDQDYFLDENDTEEMVNLLSNGILYLLLTEIVLQESPPTIMTYIQQGSANSPDQTHGILLRWLINRDVKPLHPQRKDVITYDELASIENFQEDAHESLIEALLYTYINRNLSVEDVVEAIAAMNDGNESKRDYPFDLEDALLGWINQITIIFHNSTGQSGDAPVIEEDLWKGLSDGIAVLKAIAAYRPDALGEDLTFFGNNLSLKDKVFNWQKIIEICDKSMNVLPSFPALIIAKADDPLFKSNLMAYIVDMFCALVYEVNEENIDDSTSTTDDTNSYEYESGEEDRIHSEYQHPTTVNLRLSSVSASTTRLKQSQLVEVQSSLSLLNKEDETTLIEDEDDSVLLEPIKLNPSITQRAATASSRRYVQPRESTSINLLLSPSTNDMSNSILEFGGDMSDSVVQIPKTVKQSTTLMTLGKTPVKNDRNTEVPITITNASSSTSFLPSESIQFARNSKPNKSIAIAHLSQVFKNKESLNNVAASLSGVIPWRAQCKTSDNALVIQQTEDPTDKIKSLLEQKQKENALLRMKLVEQEKQIEKEREMMKQALEQRRYEIEQEAIRKYIEPNMQAKKERAQRVSILVRSSSQSSYEPPKRVITPRVDSSATRTKGSTSSRPESAATRPDAKTPESKWNRNGVIQIMPQDQLMNTAANKKRLQKLEELRRQKIEEENKRKQDMINQKKQQTDQTQQKSTSSASNNGPNFALKNLKTHARTNKQLIKNAISHVCLAGRVNEKEKSEILTILQETDSNEHFVILVRDDKSPVFKALYTIAENTSSSDTNSAQLSQESGMSGMSSTSSTTAVPQNLRKLVGKGPRTLTADMIKAFFRYDSGGKRFIAQPTKTFGVNTDAVVLSDQIARKLVKKKP